MSTQAPNRKRKVQIGPLNSIGGLVVEMARVYRQARRLEIDTVDAGRLVYMLTQMRAALEASDIERRLDALERAR